MDHVTFEDWCMPHIRTSHVTHMNASRLIGVCRGRSNGIFQSWASTTSSAAWNLPSMAQVLRSKVLVSILVWLHTICSRSRSRRATTTLLLQYPQKERWTKYRVVRRAGVVECWEAVSRLSLHATYVSSIHAHVHIHIYLHIHTYTNVSTHTHGDIQ